MRRFSRQEILLGFLIILLGVAIMVVMLLPDTKQTVAMPNPLSDLRVQSAPSPLSTDSEDNEQNLQQEITNLKSELDVLKKNSNTLQPKEVIRELIKEVPAPEQSTKASALVKKWEPVTLVVGCYFLDQNGIPSVVNYGSGYLTSFSGQAYVFTNRHVMLNDSGFGADGCVARSSSTDESMFSTDLHATNLSDDRDFGYFIPDSPSSKTLDIASQTTLCSKQPSIGDQVLIMGYPSIGSSDSVTVTDGIISGLEGDYLVTSAKIDHGNSGGVAVWAEKDCYFGIPTGVIAGQLESLGRILSIDSVF